MNKPEFTSVIPVLRVADLVKSLDHYNKALGFDIAWKWSEADEFNDAKNPTFACVCRGDINLFLSEGGQGNLGTWICLNVQDRDALQILFEEYKNNGADIAEEPQDCAWGMREMLVKDIDGNTFRMGCLINID